MLRKFFYVLSRRYLTIRLRARDFYEVIVDEKLAEPESTITSEKSRASNLIVLVESEITHKVLHKNIEKRELDDIFKKKMRQENDCFATRCLSRNRLRVE